MAKKPYLSIEEVAKYFGVNVTTIYRLVQRGELPGFKIGSQWRFSEDFLDSWVADKVTVKWLTAEEANPFVGRRSDVARRRKNFKLKSK